MSANYSSNCPISRPAEILEDNYVDVGGMAWSDRIGLFYASENPLLPIKQPNVTSLNTTMAG